MRELVDIEFVDRTAYNNNETQDVAGVVMPHSWGPVDTVVPYTLASFLATYPQENSPYWVKVKSAFLAGASVIEVVRPSLLEKYLNVSIHPTTFVGTATRAAAQFTTTDPVSAIQVASKYPGQIPILDPTKAFDLRLTVAIIEDEPTVGVALLKGTDIIEYHVGGLDPTQTIEGKSNYIQDVVNRDSKYLKVKIDSPTPFLTALAALPEGTTALDIDDVSLKTPAYVPSTVAVEDLTAAYAKFYGSSVTTKSTVLFPIVSSQELNNAVIVLAANRSDCVSIVGLPVSTAFTKDAIKTFHDSLTKEKFGIFYAGRTALNYSNGYGVIVDDGIGAVVGRYCSVANAASINQIPSAKAYGAYPLPLVESLDFNEVLELHTLGVNSIYNSADGPQMFGVKSLHPRQTSYYAKANIMRTLAFILRTSLDYVNGVIHTPNTTNKKASTELNRQTELDKLIAQEVLRPQTLAICNDQNNQDADTNGGEILILDLDIWFVKLIESIKIRVTASDSSTTVNIQ